MNKDMIRFSDYFRYDFSPHTRNTDSHICRPHWAIYAYYLRLRYYFARAELSLAGVADYSLFSLSKAPIATKIARE